MRPPEEIEAMLSKLMPVAISEEGRLSMEEMLDELCGPETTEVAPVSRTLPWRWIIPPVGIAAATALALFLPEKPAAIPVADVAPAAESPVPELVLVGETDRIESMADEGWMSDPRGEVMQAVRVRVVEENTFRDERTGIVMQISSPREELLLYQVNAF